MVAAGGDRSGETTKNLVLFKGRSGPVTIPRSPPSLSDPQFYPNHAASSADRIGSRACAVPRNYDRVAAAETA